mgnify:CR=1 FL=1
MTADRRLLAAAVALTVLLPLSGGCGFCLNCKSDYTPPARPDPELLKLAAFMTGSFSSAAQAAEDPEFREITLEMARIWRTRPDAVWLYVEQAVAARPDRPYRQRIYRLGRVDDDTFVSDIYLLPDDEAWIGAWSEPPRFDTLTPDDLTLKEGCGAVLDRLNVYTYEGGTAERTCPSELHGASYATSEVQVRPGRIESLDRGWDEQGKQIWGSTRGAYVFLRNKRWDSDER